MELQQTYQGRPECAGSERKALDLQLKQAALHSLIALWKFFLHFLGKNSNAARDNIHALLLCVYVYLWAVCIEGTKIWSPEYQPFIWLLFWLCISSSFYFPFRLSLIYSSIYLLNTPLIYWQFRTVFNKLTTLYLYDVLTDVIEFDCIGTFNWQNATQVYI